MTSRTCIFHLVAVMVIMLGIIWIVCILEAQSDIQKLMLKRKTSKVQSFESNHGFYLLQFSKLDSHFLWQLSAVAKIHTLWE